MSFIQRACYTRIAATQAKTGYRVEVLTLRKLEYETDAFAFIDKVCAETMCQSLGPPLSDSALDWRV